jgi:hypothetical protein
MGDVLPDDLPHQVVVQHVLPLYGGELLLDQLADVGQVLRGVDWQQANVLLLVTVGYSGE